MRRLVTLPAVLVVLPAAASTTRFLARPLAAGTLGRGTLYAALLALRGGDGIRPVFGLLLPPTAASATSTGLPGATSSLAAATAAGLVALRGITAGIVIVILLTACAGSVIVIGVRVARHVLMLSAAASAAAAAPASLPPTAAGGSS